MVAQESGSESATTRLQQTEGLNAQGQLNKKRLAMKILAQVSEYILENAIFNSLTKVIQDYFGFNFAL